jgi:hypothetical protein
VDDREHRRRAVVLEQHQVGLLARGDAADEVGHPQRLRPAHGGELDHVGGAQRVPGDGLALGVRLQVLAAPVGREGGPHG